ncbi:sporulation inhibitor of replication protein SirA [Fictibacillus barbaricus]|uniref:Sporulation inhibitor of replication protein SirA n=1 Tax=Fictibacillus barbaricus TaxID=182136 RepID=A0ABU1TYH6_9BACL|nr:sporulation inhibitor of replication protein SirA [Fictibacillus barbaricus]MDR7072246.1 hypothetical protein [Fictibacillus barbaricus]
MREFYIYLITKEVAHAYYGKENKLFQLFLEERGAAGNTKEILEKQISYVTSLLPISQLEEHFWEQLNDKYQWQYEGHSYRIDCKNSTARLEINKRNLHVYSFGDMEAETVIFEALRRFEPYFLGMDYHLKKFGWLTPFKLNKVYAT